MMNNAVYSFPNGADGNAAFDHCLQVYKPERLIAADHGENICLMHQMKDILSGNAAMESDAACLRCMEAMKPFYAY